MEKLKEFKNKHDHLFTKILKVSIFSLVMLAPMFAVLAKCLYTLNPNAKDSYYGETINESENVVSNQLVTNQEYHFLFNNIPNYSVEYPRPRFYCDNIELIWTSTTLSSETINLINNAHYFSVWEDTQYNGKYISFEGFSNAIGSSTVQLEIKFTYLYKTNTNVDVSTFFGNNLWQVKYNDYSYIDNVFYYSVNQIGNEQIFSWTKQTAIYNAVNTMTSGLGIDPTNNILAVLLTYWTLITAVYVIIDIVLEMFIKITHFIS